MNPTERAICARLRELRKNLGLSQLEFAQHLGTTCNQVIGLENARVPVRYLVAWTIREVFGASLSWLSTGLWPVNEPDFDPWPAPDKLEKPGILLSEVEKLLLSADTDSEAAKTAEANWLEHHGRNNSPRPRRFAFLGVMKQHLNDWFARVPDEFVEEFAESLSRFAENFLTKAPKDRDTKIKARASALAWEQMRYDLKKHSAQSSLMIQGLTSVHASVKSESVKAQWPLLKQRLQKATSATGEKSKLAEFLGVKLASVSQWLTDKDTAREPGAETALRMLYWVEHRERK